MHVRPWDHIKTFTTSALQSFVDEKWLINHLQIIVAGKQCFLIARVGNEKDALCLSRSCRQKCNQRWLEIFSQSGWERAASAATCTFNLRASMHECECMSGVVSQRRLVLSQTATAVYELYHFGSASIRWSPDARHTRGWSFWSFCWRSPWGGVWARCCQAERVGWRVCRSRKGKTGSSCCHTARNIEESMGQAPTRGWWSDWQTSAAQASMHKIVFSPSQHSSWLIYCTL